MSKVRCVISARSLDAESPRQLYLHSQSHSLARGAGETCGLDNLGW